MRNRCPFSARSQITNESHVGSKLDKSAPRVAAVTILAIRLVISGRIYNTGMADKVLLKVLTYILRQCYVHYKRKSALIYWQTEKSECNLTLD